MNSQEAKKVLAAYRPGSSDSADPQVEEALEQACRDPALERWLEQHSAFQAAMRQGFRAIPVPAHRADRIASQPKVILAPSVWRRPQLWAAAAAIFLLLALGGVLWLKPSAEDSFATFRARMVRSVLREYRMDVVTNDTSQIRQFLASHKAPADYEVGGELARLAPVGAGLLSWQDRRVSMICLDSGRQSTWFLFVVDRSAVKRPPSSNPDFVQVNKLVTAGWTHGDKAYLLAAPTELNVLRKYF